MKLRCDERKIKKAKALYDYWVKRTGDGVRYSFFAWLPVRVGPNDCRWLERVWCTEKLSEEGGEWLNGMGRCIDAGNYDLALLYGDCGGGYLPSYLKVTYSPYE